MPQSSPDAQTPRPAPVFAALVFAALGDVTRLSLLRKLSQGDQNRGGAGHPIARLAADTRLTRQAVTKHLRILEKAGLVKSVRAGRESRFAYTPETVIAAASYLKAMAALWDAAGARANESYR